MVCSRQLQVKPSIYGDDPGPLRYRPRWVVSVPDDLVSEGSLADEFWMREALAEAEKALALGEVPVGAVVVRHGVVIGRGHNRRETDRDPLAHAEILAIRAAAREMHGWRLTEASLFVTLEPCAMCAGALVNSRVERLVFGAKDPKAGFCGSLGDLVRDPRLNHRLDVSSGVLERECAAVLRSFFLTLRRRGKASGESL